MKSSKTIAYGGILTALSFLFLYLTNVIPVNKLFLLGLSSCLITLGILLINTKNSFIVYISVSILTLILQPNIGVGITYTLIFGLYPFVKYFVERKRNIPIEILIKLLFFNIVLFLSYVLYSSLFVDLININLAIYLLLLLLQFVFILYDFALTAFVAYSDKKLLKLLKK